ncbi:MAG: LysR family transcriptional regulator [Rhodospirillales bacterium 20-60-12]|nr:MAG: LysR family transcriptional regulator [Rhodospirillales bacterium 20-60-12]HQT68634.1 LysR family transcriptional regulator [Acetobacteraceae bacterium]
MLDGISLDQLRVFIAAADEGSFSAAGRRLGRTQSVVSQTIGNLEGQIGVTLFDRSARYPKLTPEGRILISDARAIAAGIDTLKARAKGIAGGLEAELSLVVDVMFPMARLTEAVRAFARQFPVTPLRLYVEALGAAVQPVIDGRCSLGIIGSLPLMPVAMTQEKLIDIVMVMVAAHDHPLASCSGNLAASALGQYIQLVLTDRSELSAGREFGVRSPRTWRLADLGAKHAFLLSGLGFGAMPLELVAEDIAAGRLVRLAIEDMPDGQMHMPMCAFYPANAPPGPAGRWLIDRLQSG